MGRIQTSVGLITGTNITSTVDQLIKISAQPRDRLQARVTDFQSEQTALTELTTLMIGVQLASRRLASESLYSSTKVSSSNETALGVARSGSPTVGDVEVQVVRLAQTHLVSSKSFATPQQELGFSGTLQIRSQGFVDQSRSLDDLNGGAGVQGGFIRLTDRSGTSELIDLRSARTIDDVLITINQSSTIQVQASADGDRLVLKDTSGGTGLLRVDDVGGTRTATDLGFNQIAIAADSVTGADVLRLNENTKLSSLRDALGIEFNQSGNDLAITLRDGTNLEISLSDLNRAADKATGTTNANDPNAQLSIQATTTGGADDGVTVVFVDDATVVAGSESVELIESGQSRQLIFRIDAGNSTAADLQAALADNTTLSARFTATTPGTGLGVVSTSDTATLAGGAAIEVGTEPTLGDLIRTLNAFEPNKLRAKISTSGDAIQLIDLTNGSGDFVVENATGSQVASQLGLVGSVSSSSITGTTLGSGLRSVRLESLGKIGSAALGTLNVTTRNGDTGAIDLSGARTLQDVIQAIGESGLGLEASFNNAGTGLSIRDLSGATTSEFIISSSDDTADRLGIRTSTIDSVINGQDLERKFVSTVTSLSTLNQGRGVDRGSFTITDSNGLTGQINLRNLEAKTVGDVVNAINGLNLAVEARVNSAGDGIDVIDTGNGTTSLSILDSSGRTAASDLRIAGTAQRKIVDGKLVNAISGSQVDRVVIQASDTLESIAAKLQSQAKLVSASVTNGASGPRLQLLSKRGGDAGRLAVDDGGLGLQLRNVQIGQDAVIAVGSGANAQHFFSADGVFSDAISGVTLTAKTLTENPVKVNVANDTDAIVSAVTTIVDQYNKLVEKIDAVSFFNVDQNTTGILFGTTEVLQIRSSFGRLMTNPFSVKGNIRTLENLGVSLNEQGKLELSSSKLREKLESDPDSVQAFLSEENRGFQAKVLAVTERFTAVNGGLLLNRNQALSRKIDSSNARINSMNLRLEGERERLLKQFYSMETAISKLQSNSSYINSIQRITIPTES